MNVPESSWGPNWRARRRDGERPRRPAAVEIESLEGRRLLAAPTIAIQPATFPMTPGQPLTGVVLATVSTVPALAASDLTAVIQWGNGQSSLGVVNPTAAPGVFTVTSSYAYPSAGAGTSFPVTVIVTGPGGASATAQSTALVVNTGAAFGFTGGLAPFSDTSVTHAGGFTNTNRPTFSGTAPPFAIVQLNARRIGVDAPMVLGKAVAGASGQWSLATGPLATASISSLRSSPRRAATPGPPSRSPTTAR